MDMMIIANLLFAILRAVCFLAGLYVAKCVLFDSGLRFDAIFENPASRASRVVKAFLLICLGYLFANALVKVVDTIQAVTEVVWYQILQIADAPWPLQVWWNMMEPPMLVVTRFVLLVVAYGLAALAFVWLDWKRIAQHTGWVATPVEKALVLLTMGSLLFAPAELVANVWNQTMQRTPLESTIRSFMAFGQNVAWLSLAAITILFLFWFKPRSEPLEKHNELHEKHYVRRAHGKTSRAAISGLVSHTGRAGFLRRRGRRPQRGHGGVDRGGVQHPAAGGDRPAAPPGQP
jgi:hypothetical protein